MADDILGDLLRAHDGPGEAPRANGLGDVIGRAVGTPRQAAPAAPAPDLVPLLGLDDAALGRLLRYMPSDAVVPLLAHAPMPVVQRIVGMLDAESQAWLASQSESLESCPDETHAAAARKALSLIDRARAAPGTAPAAAPAAPPARRPVEVGMSFSTPSQGAVEAPVPVVATVPAVPKAAQAASHATGDDTLDTLAALVAMAAGRDPAQMLELAEAVDHPVLAAGLRSIAGGGTAHDADEAVRCAGAAWIAEQERRIELMRQAIHAIRFGDDPQRFRAQAGRV
jgi:hypothetical protein